MVLPPRGVLWKPYYKVTKEPSPISLLVTHQCQRDLGVLFRLLRSKLMFLDKWNGTLLNIVLSQREQNSF